MSRFNDGGQAFPVLALSTAGDEHYVEGMSLRDWFAGQALAGLCANPGGPFQANEMQGWGMCNCDEHTVARTAYTLADAVLQDREAQS